MLDDNLAHPEEDIQRAAAAALGAFARQYAYLCETGSAKPSATVNAAAVKSGSSSKLMPGVTELWTDVAVRYVWVLAQHQEQSSPLTYLRRGVCLAIAALPRELLMMPVIVPTALTGHAHSTVAHSSSCNDLIAAGGEDFEGL